DPLFVCVHVCVAGSHVNAPQTASSVSGVQPTHAPSLHTGLPSMSAQSSSKRHAVHVEASTSQRLALAKGHSALLTQPLHVLLAPSQTPVAQSAPSTHSTQSPDDRSQRGAASAHSASARHGTRPSGNVHTPASSGTTPAGSPKQASSRSHAARRQASAKAPRRVERIVIVDLAKQAGWKRAPPSASRGPSFLSVSADSITRRPRPDRLEPRGGLDRVSRGGRGRRDPRERSCSSSECLCWCCT